MRQERAAKQRTNSEAARCTQHAAARKCARFWAVGADMRETYEMHLGRAEGECQQKVAVSGNGDTQPL